MRGVDKCLIALAQLEVLVAFDRLARAISWHEWFNAYWVAAYLTMPDAVDTVPAGALEAFGVRCVAV